jgi:uncharacterized protein (UPF0128 family)
MDKYYKRCRIITDLFMKTYEQYIICLSEEDDDKFEIILDDGTIIIIRDDTSWKDITELMKDKCDI